MIAALEQALTGRLEAARAAAGLSARIASYGGQLDDGLIERMSNAAPALYVTFSGMTRKTPRRRLERRLTASFAVLAAGRAMAGRTARGGGRGGRLAGAYDLLALALSALSGFAPHLENGQVEDGLECSRIDNLFSGPVRRDHLAVYGLGFETPLILPPPGFATEGLEDLLSIHHTAAIGGEETPPMQTDLPQRSKEPPR